MEQKFSKALLNPAGAKWAKKSSPLIRFAHVFDQVQYLLVIVPWSLRLRHAPENSCDGCSHDESVGRRRTPANYLNDTSDEEQLAERIR